VRLQTLESVSSLVHNPLLHRTFGGWVTGAGFQSTNNRTLATSAPVKSFDLRVAVPCLQAKSAQEWMEVAKRNAAASSNAKVAQARTAAWWRAFWDRSWILVKGDEKDDESIDVPGQAHPLRIGYDSNRQSTFPGEIGRTGVYNRALSEAEILLLAQTQNGNTPPVKLGLRASGDGTPREIANETLDIKRGFTLEAWIKTDGTRDGRIFDKATVGTSDGFLLDTYPRGSLRIIVGKDIVQAPAGLLAANAWQHVAATFSSKSGEIRVYLNGKVIAQKGASTRTSLTQALTLQRYAQGCAGRGNFPIKFNGSIFTVDATTLGQPFDADWRLWGETHWYQNLRFIYHAMLPSGDTDMMKPFFRLYTNVRPLAEARTRIYFGAEGAFFPETMTVWGTYGNADYGWDRTGKAVGEVNNPALRYIWSQGPELVALMLDHWDYTSDKTFLQKETLPMAVSVMKYFDTRFKKDANGKILINPTQAVESVSRDVVNDTPNAAGLTAISARLCALPDSVTTPQQRAFFKHMKAAAPDVPVEEIEVNGKKTRVLAPAQKYTPHRANIENVELYAIWPFRLYRAGQPDLEVARATYERRPYTYDTGWSYDANAAAVLGMTEEAARGVKAKVANSNPAYRWPASWGPNFDWVPDQDNGSNLLIATHLMLLQSEGKRILVLPSWPKEWDVSFKLHAPQNTTVECVYRGGKIERLVVTPKARQKDVVLPAAMKG
jgi:hypothetical protein